ncbi:hypothetical protein CFC21_021784, partial [Triticum aestivum]
KVMEEGGRGRGPPPRE